MTLSKRQDRLENGLDDVSSEAATSVGRWARLRRSFVLVELIYDLCAGTRKLNVSLSSS